MFDETMAQVREMIAEALKLKSAEGESPALCALVAKAHGKLARAHAELVESLRRPPTPVASEGLVAPKRYTDREGIIAIVAALDRSVARSARRPPRTPFFVRRMACRIELAESLRQSLAAGYGTNVTAV
jgi:hypothetical protein